MFEKIVQQISLSHNIAILTHIKPDPDTLGSAKAMQLILQKLGKKVDTFCADEISYNNFSFLNFINTFDKKPYINYDLCIVIDCSDITRVGKIINLFYKIKNGINIDHHVDNTNFAKYNYVDSNSSSTGAIIYDLMKELNVSLDNNIANALYCAISGDTQCYSLPNVTTNDFYITSKIIKLADKKDEINYLLFKKRTFEQIELIKFALNNLQFFFDKKIVIVLISANDLAKINCNFNETYVITNLLSSIDCAELSIIATEQFDNEYSISFRSKNINCQQIAKKFGGGGHLHACGCKIKGSQQFIIDSLLEASKGVF